MQRTAFRWIGILFLFITFSSAAQQIEKGYFRSPIDETEKISLAGSFGELRPNHFHTGMDVRTCGTEGLPLYACADGYISRIYINAGGYGNAIYIDHPNGYTTVYCHMSVFRDDIARFMRQTQYKTETFEQDVHPDKNQFPVKKGDLIGLSGNTGSSEGAHLHFEIRETVSEKPVNPLLWGFNVSDSILPVIRGIKVYAIGPGSFVEAIYPKGRIVKAKQGENLKIEVGGKAGTYYLKNVMQLRAGGQIGFSIEADDYLERSGHAVEPFSIELCMDKERHYYHNMARLDFDMKRFVNTHADYAERMRTGRWFEKSFIVGNNQLPIYQGLKDNGLISTSPGETYAMQYYVKDAYDNQSVLSFKLNGLESGTVLPQNLDSGVSLVAYNKPFIYEGNGLIVNFPENTFYQDFTFKDKVSSKPPKGYSEIHEFGSRYIPVYDFYEIRIKPYNLPERLYPKAFIMSMGYGYQGGIVKDGWVVSQTRQLGKFFVSVDTIPPIVRPINVKEGANMWKSTGIRFVIGDNMAGVKSFRGMIDGHWVLFQYEGKTSTLFYLFDEYCRPGRHKLELEVTDQRDNVKRVVMNFSN